MDPLNPLDPALQHVGNQERTWPTTCEAGFSPFGIKLHRGEKGDQKPDSTEELAQRKRNALAAAPPKRRVIQQAESCALGVTLPVSDVRQICLTCSSHRKIPFIDSSPAEN